MRAGFRLMLLMALASACALEWPRLGPTPCGAVDQRCCEALDDGGAKVGPGGCDRASTCVSAVDGGVGGTCRACPTGRIACDNRCVDPTTDSDHCGACANVCGLGLRCTRTTSVSGVATGMCAHVCPTNQTWCDEAMACVALSASIEHCGRCGNACTYPNSTPVCSGGACRMGGCMTGFGNCDGVPENGCETSLVSDARNCGSCRRVCPGMLPCVEGACRCPAGQNTCLTGGVQRCADTRNDPMNCGSCNVVCPSATPNCTSGVCTS